MTALGGFLCTSADVGRGVACVATPSIHTKVRFAAPAAAGYTAGQTPAGAGEAVGISERVGQGGPMAGKAYSGF